MAVNMLNIEGLERLDPKAPVVMLNLMRFHARSRDGDGSGWDAYLRYSAITVPMIKARGGTLLWTGEAKAVALGPHDGNDWDFVALVYYPTVAAFLDMMTSEAYETRCRSASRQRLRRARDHRDQRGVQQVQDEWRGAVHPLPLWRGGSPRSGETVRGLSPRVRLSQLSSRETPHPRFAPPSPAGEKDRRWCRDEAV